MNIDALFKAIRSVYFPRWDLPGEWAVQFGNNDQCRGATGYCDSKAKTIYLEERSINAMSRAGVSAFMIHEICHDVGAAFHNRRWANRMEKAAKRADEIEEPEVASILRSDIFSYAGNGVLAQYDLPSVLEFTEELVFLNPTLNYYSVVKRVAKYFGHAPSKVRRDFGELIKDVTAGIT